MHQEFLMGNEAIALGALAAGVNLVAGYPGTPSTEVLETVAKRNPGHVYVEWSVNEKAAMEVAAGAAYSGARTLVTMKQVGLNVASDPLMSLSYIGVKGGMVVMVADDPGPISSQTEQDTRTFGQFSKVPVFDPSSVSESYQMIQDAFAFSEKYKTPVFFRATTRIDHGYEAFSVKDPEEYAVHQAEGFQKDPSKWVIFPRLSLINHEKIEKRNALLSGVFSSYSGNAVFPGSGKSKKGIVTHGINFAYTMDNLEAGNATADSSASSNPLPSNQASDNPAAVSSAESNTPAVLKIATPFPFPEDLALSFLQDKDEVLCIEELDPCLERALLQLAGKHRLNVTIRGKLSGDVKPAGENTVDYVGTLLDAFLNEETKEKSTTNTDSAPAVKQEAFTDMPALPIRPPVLCAGCPHRASFYAVKTAMLGQKSVFCGDIGCYTLGNAAPLDMCDTCLCMGAGITIAQGISHTEPDTKCFAFVGDSTFFASGITGVINAYYNQADLTLVVLDNHTTAMTGQQPHPGIGVTMMGETVPPVSIENVLKGIGLHTVVTVNPLDFTKAVETVKAVAAEKGVKAILFRSPCIVLSKPKGHSKVDSEACVGCMSCVNELGCPALQVKKEKAFIDPTLCTGCTLCEQICPTGAISGGKQNV